MRTYLYCKSLVFAYWSCEWIYYDDVNKELLKKYNYAWNGSRDKIKEVSSDEYDYEKDYIKIKFNSDDNLPLNKLLMLYLMTITITLVFKEDDKFYPQVFLDDSLYELNL